MQPKKINEKLMPIAWHPERWCKFCVLEDERKEIEPIFTEKLSKYATILQNMKVLKDVGTKDCLIFLIKIFQNTQDNLV